MPSLTHRTLRRQRTTLVASLALLVASSGCLVRARLGADGSGMLTLRYRLDETSTLGAVANRLASPSVVVRSARIDRQGVGTFKLEFTDVQTLSSTMTFRNVSVSRTPGAQPGTTAVFARFVQPKPVRLPENVLQRFGNEFRLVATFPGPIVESNAASHDGATATWLVPLQTLLTAPETIFSATYRDAGLAGAPG